MSANSGVIQRFTNAIAKGQAWVQEHSAAEIAEAIADQFPDTDVAVLTAVAQRYKETLRSVGVKRAFSCVIYA